MPKVAIELADFTAFDRHKFPDGHFDRYYSNLCLHYAENPDKVIQEASRVLKGCNEQGNHGGIAGFTVWGKRAESPVMTIVPDILKGFTKTKAADQPLKKRSPFHMGEDDEALRQRFLRDGRFSKCTVLHYPAVLESLDARDYVEAILDGAPSTKKELEEDYSKEDQQTIRRLVHEKALEILNTGDPLVLDMAMVVAQK
jgi:SAM-dependent methyltransferase